MLSPLLPPPLLAEATFSVFSVVFKAAAAAANVSRQLSNGAGKYPEGAWGTAGGGIYVCSNAHPAEVKTFINKTVLHRDSRPCLF